MCQDTLKEGILSFLSLDLLNFDNKVHIGDCKSKAKKSVNVAAMYPNTLPIPMPKAILGMLFSLMQFSWQPRMCLYQQALFESQGKPTGTTRPICKRCFKPTRTNVAHNSRCADCARNLKSDRLANVIDNIITCPQIVCDANVSSFYHRSGMSQ